VGFAQSFNCQNFNQLSKKMQGINKLCLQFVFYGVALVISLGVQASRPDLFAMFCTPLPLQDFLNQQQGLALPLNHPVVSKERVK
jgi:hypothetical protein